MSIATDLNRIQNQLNLNNLALSAVDPILAISKLGTPIFSNVIILPGTYTDYDGETTRYYSGAQLDSCILNVTRDTSIVKARTVGGAGTVKELIDKGDFNIQITGSWNVSSKHAAPLVDLALFHTIEKAPVAVKVVAPYLIALGIYEMVIEKATYNQVSGMLNKIDYSIVATSDTPEIIQVGLDNTSSTDVTSVNGDNATTFKQ